MGKINKKNFLNMVLLTCGFLASPVKAETDEYKYPQPVIAEYLKTCEERSLTEGLAQEDAKKLCTCTMNKFQNLYPVEEFNKLREEAKTNKETAEELSEVGYTCLDQILYEEPSK